MTSLGREVREAGGASVDDVYFSVVREDRHIGVNPSLHWPSATLYFVQAWPLRHVHPRGRCMPTIWGQQTAHQSLTSASPSVDFSLYHSFPLYLSLSVCRSLGLSLSFLASTRIGCVLDDISASQGITRRRHVSVVWTFFGRYSVRARAFV